MNILIMKTKEITEGVADMFLFKSVTNMPRWLEIAYGITGWLGLIGILVISIGLSITL